MSEAKVPTDAAARKALPLFSGVLAYFPDALLEVADVSRKGNDQHNPGQPLHWAKEKSRDEADALLRHLVDVGKRDTDGVRHAAKVAWRALALLQREVEAERGYGYDPHTDSWRKLDGAVPYVKPTIIPCETDRLAAEQEAAADRAARLHRDVQVLIGGRTS